MYVITFVYLQYDGENDINKSFCGKNECRNCFMTHYFSFIIMGFLLHAVTRKQRINCFPFLISVIQ